MNEAYNIDCLEYMRTLLDFVGCEIDPDYFKKQEKRFAAHTAQLRVVDLY